MSKHASVRSANLDRSSMHMQAEALHTGLCRTYPKILAHRWPVVRMVVTGGFADSVGRLGVCMLRAFILLSAFPCGQRVPVRDA